MGGKSPEEPWTKDEIYNRTQQQLIKMEQATVGTTGGAKLIEWQRYLAQQPQSYTEGGVSGAQLKRMQMEAFGEMTTIAENAATGGRSTENYQRHRATEKGTKRARQEPGISARTPENPYGFIEGSQRQAGQRVAAAAGADGRGAGAPNAYDETWAQTPTGRRLVSISPNTGNQELDALVAQSASLAGVGIVRYTGGSSAGRSARLQQVTQEARAREQAQQGTQTASLRRVNYQGQEFDSEIGKQRAQGGTLGTRQSVGSGTLLGSSS